MYGIVCAQGNHRNFTFMVHWDSFQSVRTRQCNCWTLELYVLNGDKDLHPCTFPMMFILISVIKFMEGNRAMVSRAYLKLVITEFEELFVNNIRTLFLYNSERICMNFDVQDIREPIILSVMLMSFIWDHHVQSKT